MKTWVTSILIQTAAAIWIAAPAQGAESSLRGAELKTCRPDNQVCLTVVTEKTLGSQLKALHSLASPEVRVENRKTGKVSVEKAEHGYLDIEMNQLVLQRAGKGGEVTEISWDLRTLRRSVTRFR